MLRSMITTSITEVMQHRASIVLCLKAVVVQRRLITRVSMSVPSGVIYVNWTSSYNRVLGLAETNNVTIGQSTKAIYRNFANLNKIIIFKFGSCFELVYGGRIKYCLIMSRLKK